MDSAQIIKKLKSHANPRNVEGMARFGINSKNTLGVSVPIMRKMVKEIGKNHRLAIELWASGIHEARILASMIDDVASVSEKQMDAWASDFDSWDVCDQCCMNLFFQKEFAFEKAVEWSGSREEFVKRAGFALMACLAVKDKKASDKKFEKFFTAIKKGATDERNFVKKAVNWALRQIGKRNEELNKKAIALAKEIMKMDSKSARWIAADALRELEEKAVQERLKKKAN
ncbi:MAG: DNA alkylation repair protein [Candidatus Micrarchaeota archaeon]|nr:DNA alkylation repair protein [Candidatus Micrarchaeota archaeon]